MKKALLRTPVRVAALTALLGSAGLDAGGTECEGSGPGAEILPPYPRVALGEVHRLAVRDPQRFSTETNGVPESPVLVLGRVVHDASGATASDLFVDDLMACCIAHSVGFRLGEGHGLQDGSWLAVYGRFVATSAPSLVARAPWRRDRMLSVAGGYVLEVERAVPAEQVMFPDNVVDLLDADSVSMFRRALLETGLDQRLRAEGSITLLAPVDAAFERMADVERTDLFDPSNRGELARFVLRHVLTEHLSKRALMRRSQVTTMDGGVLRVSAEGGKLKLGGCRYLFGDQRGRNGTLHLIMPALPPAPPPTLSDPYDPLLQI